MFIIVLLFSSTVSLTYVFLNLELK